MPPREGGEREQAARLNAAVLNIRVDAATAEVVRSFQTRGIDCRLLKGRALWDWYEQGLPPYKDFDLWLAPADLERAEKVLLELDFRALMDRSRMPAWWQEHADEWGRQSDGAVVDLHRRLQGLGVDEDTAWSELAAQPDHVEVAGCLVPRLRLPARALYVTLHAAHHGRIWSKALSHLTAALDVVPMSDWVEAAEIARRLEAADAFAAGLGLTPAGRARATELGLGDVESARVRLQASSPPPVARGLDALAEASWPHRAEILARKLFPPAEFIRRWWPPARRGSAWLVLGYAYRPVWLARHVPAGWRAWRAAHDRPAQRLRKRS